MLSPDASRAARAARLALALFILASSAAAQVPIGGLVSDATTGPLLSGTVYHTTGTLTVPAGATLTIQPDVIVKFAQGHQLSVVGTLVVQGTAARGVALTSILDDSFGGDTNGDGPSSGTPGFWRGVRFQSGSSGSMSFTTIAFAGWSGFAGIRLEGAPSVAVSSCTVRDGSADAVDYASNPANAGSTFTSCTFSNNGDAAMDNAPLDAVAGISSCTASGNGVDTIRVTSATLARPSLTITTANLLDDVLLFAVGAVVPVGSTLTLGPGVVLKWSLAGQMSVQGALIANGTASQPVVFTALADDDHGGDTNKDGPSLGTPGWWRGIHFLADSAGSLAGAVVRFSGRNGFAGIQLDGAPAVQISESTIRDGSTAGLDLVGSSANNGVTVTRCSFVDNAAAAVDNAPLGAVPGFTDNTATGNGLDTIRVTAGGFTSDVAIAPANLISGALSIQTAITVPVATTLVLEAGVTMKMGVATRLIVDGVLEVNGTAFDPVTFTDFRDDSVAGDTNGDGTATAPAPDSWRGLQLLPGSHADLAWATVRYPGQGGLPAFRVETATAVLTSCRAELGVYGFDLLDFAVADRLVAYQNGTAGFRALGGGGDLTHATAFGNGIGIERTSTAYTGQVLSSIAWSNTTNFDLWPAGQVRFSDGDATLAGSNGNIHADPLFTDAANGDLTLLATSPCIDAGDPSAPPDPDGTVADMGAFFFDQSVPVAYCTGKTNSLGCVPFVETSGRPSVSSTAPFRIMGRDHVPSEAGLLLYSFKKSNLGFHGGTLCVRVPFFRTPVKAASNTGAAPCTGVLSRNFNNTIQSGNDPALTAGTKVYAQWLQRDPADPTGFGENLTDAVGFLIAP